MSHLLEILEKGRKDVPFSVQMFTTSMNNLSTTMSTFNRTVMGITNSTAMVKIGSVV